MIPMPITRETTRSEVNKRPMPTKKPIRSMTARAFGFTHPPNTRQVGSVALFTPYSSTAFKAATLQPAKRAVITAAGPSFRPAVPMTAKKAKP